jgi:hypothetical protein
VEAADQTRVAAMSKRIAAWVMTLVGLGLFVIAAIEALDTSEDEPIVALLVVGSLLLVAPLVLDRLESLRVSGTGLELNLSREIADLGAPKTAERLETAGLTGYLQSYEFIRDELADQPYQEARIKLQDALVDRAASIARTQKLEAKEVRRIFAEGQPLLRVLALGLMEGDPSLADASIILDAVSASRTANEQYHGLKLAELCWQGLSNSQQAAILAAARADSRIAADSDRQAILEMLERRATGP